MAYIKFLNNPYVYKAKIKPSGNIVTLEFEGEKEISDAGFNAYLDEKCEVDIGDKYYHSFTTIYRYDDVTEKYNGYQLSDDESIYVKPEPIAPSEVSLEELKEIKKSEIRSTTESKIIGGKEFSGHKFGYTLSEKMEIRNAYEDALNSGKVALLKDCDGETIELNPSEAAILYSEQEKNRIETEAYATQLIKLVDCAINKEEIDEVVYGKELTGDYLEEYTAQIERETDLLNSSIRATKAIKRQATLAAVNNTDEQALQVKDLYKHWNDDPEGYHYSMDNPEDLRRNYGDGLWTLQKDHDKQANWFPGNDPTLWRQIVEGHEGTSKDPIPVPESVTTSGFEYEYGKYYLENDTIYLCKRGGIPNPEEMYGEKITLFYPPSAMIDSYFVLA